MSTQYKEKYHNLLKSQILPKLLQMAGKRRGKFIDIRRYRDRYTGQLQNVYSQLRIACMGAR